MCYHLKLDNTDDLKVKSFGIIKAPIRVGAFIFLYDYQI